MIATVTFQIEAPVECTKEEFAAWLNHALNRQSLSMSNPLAYDSFDIDDAIGFEIEVEE